ncbi:hypothetical protein U1769_07765 [Sphingomonas sp. ZT3P38]|uniref:hypothetical protein n=1 Tax=Parasphingomonas zepuensis TaxID=3096161 RepID=UPI002FCB739F
MGEVASDRNEDAHFITLDVLRFPVIVLIVYLHACGFTANSPMGSVRWRPIGRCKDGAWTPALYDGRQVNLWGQRDLGTSISVGARLGAERQRTRPMPRHRLQLQRETR